MAPSRSTFAKILMNVVEDADRDVAERVRGSGKTPLRRALLHPMGAA